MRALVFVLVCAWPLFGHAQQPSKTAVRPQATVEVLDDPAQVEDVISRLRQDQKSLEKTDQKAAPDLKNERLPLPGRSAGGSHKNSKDDKSQRPAWRRPHGPRDDSERTERPRRPHR